MKSAQAFILATLIGAVALLTCLLGFISLEFLQAAARYSPNFENTDQTSTPITPPKLTTRFQDSHAEIIELDKHDQFARIVYSADLNDQITDFTLVAVPQTSYAGQAFVQSPQDTANGQVIIYPLDVVTGKIEAAILKTEGQAAIPSPDQTTLAIIDTTSTKTTITLFDLTSHQTLNSWVTPAGNFKHWTSVTCFEEYYCLK